MQYHTEPAPATEVPTFFSGECAALRASPGVSELAADDDYFYDTTLVQNGTSVLVKDYNSATKVPIFTSNDYAALQGNPRASTLVPVGEPALSRHANYLHDAAPPAHIPATREQTFDSDNCTPLNNNVAAPVNDPNYNSMPFNNHYSAAYSQIPSNASAFYGPCSYTYPPTMMAPSHMSNNYTHTPYSQPHQHIQPAMCPSSYMNDKFSSPTSGYQHPRTMSAGPGTVEPAARNTHITNHAAGVLGHPVNSLDMAQVQPAVQSVEPDALTPQEDGSSSTSGKKRKANTTTTSKPKRTRKKAGDSSTKSKTRRTRKQPTTRDEPPCTQQSPLPTSSFDFGVPPTAGSSCGSDGTIPGGNAPVDIAQASSPDLEKAGQSSGSSTAGSSDFATLNPSSGETTPTEDLAVEDHSSQSGVSNVPMRELTENQAKAARFYVGKKPELSTVGEDAQKQICIYETKCVKPKIGFCPFNLLLCFYCVEHAEHCHRISEGIPSDEPIPGDLFAPYKTANEE
ncbi:hypothetical protein VKT23_004536 [Stygiomarasmius scandens]|uniref:Uncharacterized protein n=1 Tax=Marasmiellus scandens TaxID=2682957 RepID=A0ABR1JVA3_9AGAR